MIKLTIEITGKSVNSNGIEVVQYSIFDHESIGMVSMLDEISIQLACYLSEFEELRRGLFLDFCYYISSTNFDNIEVGKVFIENDEE